MLDHDLLRSAALVVVDGNLPAATVDAVLDAAPALGVRVVLDPVSVRQGAADRAVAGRAACSPITPNEDELAALGSVEELHARGVEVVWVRRGAGRARR